MRRPDFLACYDAGHRLFSKSFILFALSRITESPGQGFRAGVGVSKKAGPAVRRNRLKRLVREFFRLHQRELHLDVTDMDFVVVPKRGLDIGSLTQANVNQELTPLVRKALDKSNTRDKGCCNKPEGSQSPTPRGLLGGDAKGGGSTCAQT